MSSSVRTLEQVKAKLGAAGLHLLLSVLVAGTAGMLVFYFWFPKGLAGYVGGAEIYAILIGVELVLGPVMSLVIYSIKKPRTELIRDYCVVVAVQIAALFYGVYIAMMARPEYVVFVKDRFEVVAFSEVVGQAIEGNLGERPYGFGPRFVSVKFPDSIEESNRILFSALQGVDIHLMPEHYANFNVSEVVSAAKPVSELLVGQGQIAPALAESIRQCLDCIWLPMVRGDRDWVAIIDVATGYPKQYLDIPAF